MYTLQSILNWNTNLFNGVDVTPFNALIIENENIPPIEQDSLVSNILLRCGLLQPIYGEPNLLQSQIGLWWKSNIFNFYQIWRGMHLSYNPIENYDRYENTQRNLKYDHTSNDSGTDTQKNSGNDITKNTGTDTTKDSGSDTSTDSKQDITEEKISAFNENSYQPKSQNTVQYGKQNTFQHGKQTAITYGGTSTLTHGMETQYIHGKENKYIGDDKDIYASHMHGNIGVTTNQQMLTQELILRQKNVYEYIADNFEANICITVY